jgi:prefoldin subunit 5
VDWVLERVMNEIKETVNDIAMDIACLMDEADDLVLSLAAVQDKLTRLQNTLDELSSNGKQW